MAAMQLGWVAGEEGYLLMSEPLFQPKALPLLLLFCILLLMAFHISHQLEAHMQACGACLVHS